MNNEIFERYRDQHTREALEEWRRICEGLRHKLLASKQTEERLRGVCKKAIVLFDQAGLYEKSVIIYDAMKEGM